MEQKRLLWIIAAVGVFLLVVLGAALIIYAPASKTPQSIATTNRQNSKAAANGWISLAPAEDSSPLEKAPLEGFSEEQEFNADGTTVPHPLNFESGKELRSPDSAGVQDLSKTSGDFKVSELIVHTENATVIAENVSSQPADNSTTIDLNIAAASKPAQNTTLPQTKKAAPAPAKETVKKAEPAKRQAVAYKAKKAPAKAAETKKAAAPKKPEVIQYWIQVTALTSRKSADSAREELAKHQITADVFTYTNNKNQLFYRVRVGPYTTKTEAEYWRNRISQIDTFAKSASYVTSTKTEQL